MGVNKLTGTPWHTEKFHRAENDNRRYKGRCAFYNYKNEYCTRYCGRCRGSAHCRQYKAISEEEFKERQKENRRTKNNTLKENDNYWF